MFECCRCGYKSNVKNNLRRHLNKKNKCNPIKCNKTTENCLFELNLKVEHKCEYCLKIFDRSNRLKKHHEKCKLSVTKLEKYIEIKLQENNKQTNKINQEYKNNIDILQEEIKKYKETLSEHGGYNEFIYIIQEREFIKNKQPIYKIGKTTTPFTRIRKYPKSSLHCLCVPVSNCVDIEKKLLIEFEVKFIKRKDFGSEYFQGDLIEMIKTVLGSVQ